MNHKLVIEFEIGRLSNGKSMDITLTNGDQIYHVDTGQKSCKQTLEVDLPDVVLINFSNKDQNTDTIVDTDGNIVEDCYVKIQNISLDTFDMDPMFREKKLILERTNGESIPIAGSYIGFNGCVKLNLDQPTIFSQIMYWRRPDIKTRIQNSTVQTRRSVLM